MNQLCGMTRASRCFVRGEAPFPVVAVVLGPFLFFSINFIGFFNLVFRSVRNNQSVVTSIKMGSCLDRVYPMARIATENGIVWRKPANTENTERAAASGIKGKDMNCKRTRGIDLWKL